MAEKDEKGKEVKEGVMLTEEALTRIMTSAVRAGQQPTAEEQAEKDAEAARKVQRRRLMLRLVETDMKAKLKRQAMCQHRKPDGENAWGGQAHSDGMNRVICLRCQKIMVEEPTQEFAAATVELQRLIDAGQVKVRPDGTIEVFNNRMAPRSGHRSLEEQELEA